MESTGSQVFVKEEIEEEEMKDILSSIPLKEEDPLER
jgi:hypothetical protein